MCYLNKGFLEWILEQNFRNMECWDPKSVFDSLASSPDKNRTRHILLVN